MKWLEWKYSRASLFTLALFFFHQWLEYQESLYFMLENFFFSSFNSLYFQVVNELIRMWHKNEQKIAKKKDGNVLNNFFFMMELWKLSKEFFKLLMKMSGAIFFCLIEWTIPFFGFGFMCVCESQKWLFVGSSEMRHLVNVMDDIHWIRVDLVKNFASKWSEKVTFW